jgi:mannose-6-phosphate isomerase-like protein (cupin superfamily)
MDEEDMIVIAEGIAMKVLNRTNDVSIDFIVSQPHTVESDVMHRRTDEFIILLEGELDALIGGKTARLTPGDTVSIARGTWHRFTNVLDRPARLLSVCTPPYSSEDVYLGDTAAAESSAG